MQIAQNYAHYTNCGNVPHAAYMAFKSTAHRRCNLNERERYVYILKTTTFYSQFWFDLSLWVYATRITTTTTSNKKKEKQINSNEPFDLYAKTANLQGKSFRLVVSFFFVFIFILKFKETFHPHYNRLYKVSTFKLHIFCGYICYSTQIIKLEYFHKILWYDLRHSHHLCESLSIRNLWPKCETVTFSRLIHWIMKAKTKKKKSEEIIEVLVSNRNLWII